jgi:hypothetical protein
MNQSTLKKEFSQSTVQRMRNIISNNAGDRTQVQTGWEKRNTDYQEGDIWEESGKRWTIKNGIKQTITKLDNLKKLVVLPLTCPECKKAFKIHDVNKKMYSIHGMCLDCVTEMETKLKIEGKYEQYEKGILNKNKNASLEEFEMGLEAWLKENDSFVTESGDVESWGKVDKTKMYEEIKSNIEKLKQINI